MDFQQSSQILGSLSGQKSQDIKATLKTFKSILQEVGIHLSFNDEPHILKQEQALVLKDLEKVLKSTEKCEDFLKGLKLLCKKEKHFRKALLLSNLKKSNNNESISSKVKNERIEQESLMKIFMKVPQLQKNVFEILYDEISTNGVDATEDTSWLHLLLNPLCYIPSFKEPEFITTKLLDILEIANYPAQLEILNCIPEIIPDVQHGKTAEELCMLMDDKNNLTGAIVDCLNALGLDSEIRNDVQDRILSKIISGEISPKVLPVVMTFLLTDCKSLNLVQTLLKIRNAIDTQMQKSEKSDEHNSCKILIFNKLQSLAVSSKNISEALLNMISAIKISSDHKPVDYLILFMLHHAIPFKKKIIEAIFKKRVHNGLFKINMLEKIFERYLLDQLMKDYFQSIIEIGCSLIRGSNDTCTREFSITIFKLLFSHQNTESIYRRDILDNLIILVGANDKKSVDTVLKILVSFFDNKEYLQKHTISLMKLLEKIESLELKHVKQVFDILCSLTCGEDVDESMAGMRDEIHMLIRKQIYSTKQSIKHRGIISAIVMVRHIVTMSTEQTDYVPKPIPNVSDIPSRTIREAAALLELTYTCTSSCPELTSLYYDQLTSMLMTKTNFEKDFLTWLYMTIEEGFESTYIVNNLPISLHEIQLKRDYLINEISEASEDIAVNIGGLVLRNDPKILLLAPHFRLLRILHYLKNDGQLDTIDAVLGCSVVMPDVDIEDLDTNQVKQTADCFFHCINWLREILSAFVPQKSLIVRTKVLKRLKTLLEMENKLNDLMIKIPDHKLPISYFNPLDTNKQFISPAKTEKVNNPRKKLKTVADGNQTVDMSKTLSSQQPRKKSVTTSSNSLRSLVFREMDTDILLLMKYPLSFSENEMTQSDSHRSISINELKFLLVDLVSKLDALSNEKDLGLQHLQIVAPIQLIKDCSILFVFLERHLKVFVNKIKELLGKTDGRLDLPEMFTPDAVLIKMCFGLIIKTYQLIYSWTGFQYSSNIDVLKNLLKSTREDNSQTLNSAHRLIIESIQKMSSLHEYCLELSHGVNLIQTIQSLYALTTPSQEVQKKIVTVSEKLLSKRWFNAKGFIDSGKQANLSLDILIKAYLSSANLKTISGLVGTLQNQVDKLQTNEDCLHMLPSIDKRNFHVFYNGLCTALLQRVKCEVQALTNNEHLILWKTTTITMQGLMTIAKAQETKTNLSSFLKKSIGILKVFLSDGIPILELTLRSKPDDVVDIFKMMQTSTRFLHHLCCYSKLTKDSSLMAFVPKFRLTLETLVYRVKAALAANNCSSAFWMGNLKNRDLQGEDILSQSTTITETNEENSEDELPEDDDDDSDSESVAIERNSNNNGSASSEVFD